MKYDFEFDIGTDLEYDMAIDMDYCMRSDIKYKPLEKALLIDGCCLYMVL